MQVAAVAHCTRFIITPIHIHQYNRSHVNDTPMATNDEASARQSLVAFLCAFVNSTCEDVMHIYA